MGWRAADGFTTLMLCDFTILMSRPLALPMDKCGPADWARCYVSGMCGQSCQISFYVRHIAYFFEVRLRVV